MDDLILVLDAGTGGGRALTLDAQGRVRGRAHRSWSYFEPEGLEVVGREFHPGEFAEILAECSRAAVAAAPGRVAGVVATGQRHGCVFQDRHDACLYAGPNRDARGINYAEEIEARLGADRAWRITGHWPPWIFLAARLEWFRRERPKTFAAIRRVLMIPDWVGWLLTGRAATEPTAAADTLLFDVGQKGWSPEILSALELDPAILPEVCATGARLGGVTASAAPAFGVPAGTPVFIGAADTQAAMMAAQAFDPGEVCIVAGSTAPVMGVMDQPRIDPGRRLWTGCHPAPGRWLCESNAGNAGLQWRDFILGFLGFGGGDPAGLYARIEKEMEPLGPGAGGVRAFAGPQIWDLSSMTPGARGGLFTPFPPDLQNSGPAAVGRALLENTAYALRANLGQVEALAGPAETVSLAGGLTRSRVFGSIVANVLGREVRVAAEPEATALGCAIIGFAALGVHGDWALATRAMIRYPLTLAPDSDTADEYTCLYDEWREEYARMMGLTE